MKTTFILFFVFLFLLQPALATNHIYKVEGPLSVEGVMDVYADSISDAIPELGIVVGDEAVLSKTSLRSLGPITKIQLNLPEQRAYDYPKNLWGVKAIKADAFWPIAQGENVIVAVSDTGVDFRNPTLADSKWVNPGEIPGNGIDDDNNGYIDDIHGWNFNLKKPAARDNHYHGTHVAGTIAARASSKIIGVAPKAQIMSLAFLSSKGSGTDLDGAKTLVYAANNGARIVNCSWGGPGSSPIIEEAIRYAESKDVLVVVAAGNEGANIDVKKFVPAGLPNVNLLTVGATNKTGGKPSWSNHGKIGVDVAAPGDYILSASNGSSYRYLSGTSMATPHAAGLAALILSAKPKLNFLELKNLMMSSTTPLKSWQNKSVTGGQIDASKAAQLILQ